MCERKAGKESRIKKARMRRMAEKKLGREKEKMEEERKRGKKEKEGSEKKKGRKEREGEGEERRGEGGRERELHAVYNSSLHTSI